MTLRRGLTIAFFLGVLYFAIQGGEYGTSDLLSQQSRERRARRAVDSLQALVDSLVARKKAVQTDPVVQERIAREEFGMVKGDRELLYRFVEDQPTDSTRR
jgi:cell division protein FtsB